MTRPRVVVYSVSDHTGLTAEAYAHGLVTQFEGLDVKYLTRSFIDSREKVDALAAEISAEVAAGRRPIVFCTFIAEELKERLERSDALVIGLFDGALELVAEELSIRPTGGVGRYHSIRDAAAYELRLAAVDYALTTDDGLGVDQYARADIILAGVSRVGKTPTCLHLSLHYAIRAANYPISPEDHPDGAFPETLDRFKPLVYGLTIEPRRLHVIRMQRRPGSPYASLDVCRREIAYAESMFQAAGIPYLDTTSRSIEEITATIMEDRKLARRVS